MSDRSKPHRGAVLAGILPAAFEGLQAQLAANRSEFYRAVPSGPFHNFGQPGADASEVIIANWWRQGTMGGAKGQYDCVSEFIRQDWTDELLQNGTLKTYAGFPHRMPTTHADTLNHDLLAFIQS